VTTSNETRVASVLRWSLPIVAIVILATVPWLATPSLVQYGINALLLASLAQGWNIIGGFAGYASFGNSVFYGLGTYGTAIAMAQFHLPFAIGLALGAAMGVLCALVMGLPILRLRGPYFAIGTLGLSGAMTGVFSNLSIAGRNIGLILPLTRSDVLFYELALCLLVLATATVAWIARSRFGLGLIAIRENEDAAAVMGVNTTRYKIAALVLAALFSALAGGIHAYWITFVDPSSAFDASLNVRMIIMTIFGGPGTVLGPVVGSFVLSAVYEVLANRISSAAALLFGVVIILAVIFMPKGLVDLGYGFRQLRWRYFTRTIRQYRL
jgi:branched-chain amino acid transport system permease protein